MLSTPVSSVHHQGGVGVGDAGADCVVNAQVSWVCPENRVELILLEKDLTQPLSDGREVEVGLSENKIKVSWWSFMPSFNKFFEVISNV